MTEVETRQHDGVLGRIRSRSAGAPRAGVPEVILVHGMTACDYLLPSLAAMSGWTRAHLIDLPGCGGSGDPPHELSVAEFAAALGDWLDRHGPGRVILAGHSSGTQVATATAPSRDDVAAVVLGSPVFDPAWRTLPGVLTRWALDLTREPSGLERVNRRERKRAGLRRLRHVLHEHRGYDLTSAVAALPVPTLVVRGREDALSTRRWTRRLATLAAAGSHVDVPGPHTFCWPDPRAWSEPVREFALSLGTRRGQSHPLRRR
ncbi:alpha/beta fold hydrolase [Actinoplanes sp. KI2]|uniref:alpha/beta fold hydrolase n=1 Tax=Actinoplanes sp. KI2 TaxID=2983315 RepID=UPI0021D60828|nr:alpha/beta fold hydrolase [Actinoplanes sp. KI2]MCU7727511.1 alpha/beta fold hydrolase [Actinoplanes sp. KI2]